MVGDHGEEQLDGGGQDRSAGKGSSTPSGLDVSVHAAGCETRSPLCLSGGVASVSRINSVCTADSLNKDKIKKKKGKGGGVGGQEGSRALSVEDLFVTMSTVKVSGINPPPAKVVLTPRSAEACLKHGVNPEILRVRNLDSFWETGVEPEVQLMRHEAYSQRRHEMMRLCRQERERIINIKQRHSTLSRLGGGHVLAPVQSLDHHKKESSTVLKLEERRMERMIRRQEKELEQMLLLDSRLKKAQAENRARAETDQRRLDERKRERNRRQRELAEEKRLRELKRKAIDQAEELRRQAFAKAAQERELERTGERERRERLARAEARSREEERARIAEENRLQTQRIFEDQQMRLKRRLDKMKEQEEARQRKVEEQQAQVRRELQQRKSRAKQRIIQNLRMAAQAEEQRKANFFQKQEAHEERRQLARQRSEEERQLLARHRYLQERKRTIILDEYRAEEQARKEAGLARIEQEEEYVRQLWDRRARERFILKERNDLQKQLKMENVNRIQRIQEYRRLEILRQIKEANRRTKEIATKKEEMISKRRKAALEATMKKEAIARLMGNSNRNEKKTLKLIQKVLRANSGGGKLRRRRRLPGSTDGLSVNASEGDGSDDERSNSAKSSGTKDSRQACRGEEELWTRSVEGKPRGHYALATAARTDLGPPPEAPTLEARLRASITSDPSPQPYVSPYEVGVAPQGSATVTF